MPTIKIKCPAKTMPALDEQGESLEMRRPELVSGSQYLRIKCPAKINLTLEILNKRTDGFHNIQSIMQTIALYDILTISVEKSEKSEIKLSGTSKEIPYDKNNLVYKAIELFFAEMPLTSHLSPLTISVHIEKNIPVAAGLAGGSTDAAGVIYGLNRLFDKVFSGEELHQLCAKLGSDLNFCLEGGCHLATSRGEILKKLHFCEFPVSLIKPKKLGISAKEAYTKFSELEIKPNLNNTEKMFALLKTNECDCEKIEKLLYNDLEFAVINDYKELQMIKNAYPNSIMSGSGSTFFVLESSLSSKLNNDDFWIKTGLKSVNHGVVKTV